MHVVALIGTDPDVVRNSVVGEIGCKLAEVDDLCDPSRIGLDILVGDKGVVFAFIELIATSVVERSGAERIRLHVRLPRLAARFELIDDVRDVDGDVIVIRDAVECAGSGANVVGLAGMREAVIVFREASGGRGEIDERSAGIADQRGVAGVLHHDDEDTVKASVVVLAVGVRGKSERRGRNDESDKHCAQNAQARGAPDRSTEKSNIHCDSPGVELWTELGHTHFAEFL